MRAGVLSAGVFGIGERARPAAKDEELHERVPTHTAEWSEEVFAHQQIRNLVRQVFSSAGEAVRHIVFSGVELDADVSGVCCWVGQTLASETSENVLVVVSNEREGVEEDASWATPMRSRAKRVERNLWRLTVPQIRRRSEITVDRLRTLMAEMRREFEYSIVADSVGGWAGRGSLAEAADGMVLVLSALRTRRASARKLLDELSHVRLLGTVLQDREFPIPEGIYHRL
jgi:hypothetical protein